MAERHLALEEAIAMASRLGPEERKKLREAIDQMIGAPPKDDKELLFKHLLMDKGLIRQIRLPRSSAVGPDRHPVPVKGKPVSETIIEDRG